MSSSNKEKAGAASAESLEQEAINTLSDLQTRLEAASTGSPSAPNFDIDDFDDEFDDDFEAETAGEYELEDDEYARQLVEMVDFEIEGLEAHMDDEEEESSEGKK